MYGSDDDDDGDIDSAPAGPELSRPSLPDLRSRFLSLFTNPHLRLSDLRDQTLSRHGLASSTIPEDDMGSVTLRGLHWRLFLGRIRLETLCTAGGTHYRALAEDLGNKRRKYDEQRGKWLKAPDGRWAADCVVDDGHFGGDTLSNEPGPSRPRSVEPPKSAMSASSVWDPLNQGEEVSLRKPNFIKSLIVHSPAIVQESLARLVRTRGITCDDPKRCRANFPRSTLFSRSSDPADIDDNSIPVVGSTSRHWLPAGHARTLGCRPRHPRSRHV